MSAMSFAEACLAFRDGRCTSAEFEAATRDWRRARARWLLAHWRAPCWLSREDVEADLYVALHDFVFRYDANHPEAGDLDRYVKWNASDKAKKRLHKARGARLHGNPDSERSVIAKPFSSFVRPESPESDSDYVDALTRVEAEQERLVEQARRAEMACRTELEREVVAALLAEPSIKGAAGIMRQRLRSRPSLARAEELLVESARAVGCRLAGAA